MLLVIFMLCVALMLSTDFTIKRRRNKAFAKSDFKGPTALPVLGCGLSLINLSPEGMIPFCGSLFAKFGQTFRVWVLHVAHIYTMDIKIFEGVLTSSTMLEKADLYDLVRSWLSDGLLLSVGSKWRARRKIFTPAFHFKVLEHYVRIFDEQSTVMVNKLRTYADGKTAIDIFEFVGLAALDVISEAAMGVKVNAQNDPGCLYVKTLKNLTYLQADRMYKINQRYNWGLRLTAPRQYKEIQRDIKILHDFTNSVIEERHKTIKDAIANGTYKPLDIADPNIGKKEQLAFLDILLQSEIDGKPLSNADICEEVDTFTFEGHDTTTSGISYALFCISRHPEVQKKLFEEINAVIGTDKDAEVTMQQLQELKYLDCVIKEVLRLYPSVPGVGRKVVKDTIIDGQLIPANTHVYLAFYYAHRNPKYFPDPEAFKPERFIETDEHQSKRTPFAYTPFSAGPKNCIGQRFAVLEMKSMITKVLRHYELLPLGPDIEPMMNFILRSAKGMHLGLAPRNH